MKKLFLSLVALFAATVSFAQNSLVATLSHGEAISVYYGNNALINAYEHAVSGDVINLSAGTYLPVNIDKGITLRGAASWQTTINGTFTIEIDSNYDNNSFSMEGIMCDGFVHLKGKNGKIANPIFKKCAFNKPIRAYLVKDALFVNCYITEYHEYSYFTNDPNTVQFTNCYINYFDNSIYSQEPMVASFINCLFENYSNNINKSFFLNCIFYRHYSDSDLILKQNNIAQYCVSINCPNLFRDIQDGLFNKTSTFNEMFVNNGETYFPFSSMTFYNLTDIAKVKFLGDDNTEVGLYGGKNPYSMIPSYPQITKMNVAKRATNDGKLSVEIEVSAQE